MIKKIAIVPYVTYGRLAQAGHDGHLNPFKKKRSAALKENLEAALSAEKWDMEVIIDVNHGDLPGLKREGVDLFVIPEDIAVYVDYDKINKKECFQISHDAYENGTVNRIIEYIRTL